MAAGKNRESVVNGKKRQVFSGEFKAKVALESIPGVKEDSQRDRPGIRGAFDSGRAVQEGMVGTGGEPV
jgi:hypothetical protein